MIIVPKRNRLEIGLRSLGTRHEGHFTLRLGKLQPDGTVAYRREYSFPNMILDQGLDYMGDNWHYISNCQIGTGTTTPTVTDTQLVNPIAVASVMTQNQVGVVIGPPRFAYGRMVYRFAAGSGTGNLTEIGVGWANGLGATLYNRALILDSGGNPIAITKLADEVLDVTYELRCYIPTDDYAGSFTITGSGTHDYIIRAAEADQVKPQFNAGWGPQYMFGTQYWNSSAGMASNAGNGGAFTGNIGDINNQPSGGYGGPAPSIVTAPYVPGSLERTQKFTYGLGGNPIRSILYSFGWNSFQIQFDPVIPKSPENSLEIEFIHSWARRSI